jgi:uncharacterized RDD family membrane protein YckC
MAELVADSQMYARTTPRLQAFICDQLVRSMILLAIFVAASLAGGWLQVIWPIGLFAYVFYEPLFLTFRGATIGHKAMNLRVVRARDFGKVSLPRAILWTLVKGTIGLPAFLVMYLGARQQALQDFAAGTVVVPYDPSVVQPGWFGSEPPVQPPEYVLPHPLRRFVVIVAHEVGFFILATGMLRSAVPDCFPRRGSGCTVAEQWGFGLLSLSILIGFVAIIASGVTGHLGGATRRPR